jgi:tyrosinase
MSAHAPTALGAQARALRTRKNVEYLSSEQLATLRRAFTAAQAIGDDRGYGHWAGIHGLPLPMYCMHGSRLFLPWHRAYLYFFELALRDQVAEAALAWWDWTSPASHAHGLPAAYAERQIGGERNPLYSAEVPPAARQSGRPRVTARSPQPPEQLPRTSEVERVLSLPDFLDFQSQLEDIHNAVHVWVGGTMGQIPWAAFDPVFWAHHTMIDRLWRLWQLRHPHSHLPHSLLNQALPPFPMTVAETLEVKALGYRYASSSAHAVVEAQ